MKEKRRGVKRWVWLGALVVLAAVCALVYRSDGVGGSVPDIPGGFSLRVSVLDADGTVKQYDVRDQTQIIEVQHYIRSQKSVRLRDGADVRPDYPFLGFSDGEGQNARRAVYSGGVWVDSALRRFDVRLDPAEILALIPDAAVQTAALRDFPGRCLAAEMSGNWDPRLLEQADEVPDAEEFIVRARERSDDKLSVTVYNPHEHSITCRPEVRLEVLLDGDWYTVPPRDDAPASDVSDAVLEPESSALFTATTSEVEQRYGRLPAGHYRIVLLTYASEFDVA